MSEAIVKASISSLLKGLGFHEEAIYREAETELVKLLARAGSKPIEISVNFTFNDLVKEVGEGMLEEMSERAETLLEVLEDNSIRPELKSKIVELLSVDIMDIIAMINEAFNGDSSEVYAAFAEVEDAEERARKAVATFANVLLEALRNEMEF